MNKQEIHGEIDNAWIQRRSDMRASFHKAAELLEICKHLKDNSGIANCHKILGYCFWRFADFSSSMEHSLQALALFKEIGDIRGEADALNNLGAVYMFQKEHQKRLECNLKCLEIRTQLGDPDDISGSMNNIGETYLEMGDLASAEKWFVDCLNYPGSSEDSIAWAAHNLGKLYSLNKEFDASKQFFLNSLEISEAIQYHVLTTETYLELGELYRELRNPEFAINYSEKALTLARKTGGLEEEKRALLLLSSLMEASGEFQKALNYYKEFHTVYNAIHKESNLQKIKDLEFQHQLENARKEAEIERLRSVELKAAYDQIDLQRSLLEKRNQEIVDSIRYAQRIQQAVLKEEKHVSAHLPEHFIYYKPKDIVSGDFYWAQEKNGILYVAAADCTGHGVPGGFLTMLGIAFLNEIIGRDEVQTPAQVLNKLRDKFIEELKLQDSTNDGMDITLVSLRYDQDTNTKELMWAGAYNPLWVVKKRSLHTEIVYEDLNEIITIERDDRRIDLIEIKPDKQPIGKSDIQREFTNHSLLLEKEDLLYLFSDGYQDQFGGVNGKKLKKSGFKELILSLAHQPIDQQARVLEQFFESWKGDRDQVDDVCVIGIKV